MSTRFFKLFLSIISICLVHIASTQNFDIIPYPDSLEKTSVFSKIEKLTLHENEVPDAYKIWLESIDFIDFGRKANTQLVHNKSIDEEKYVLDINLSSIVIEYGSEAGFRNAIVSLLQLYQLNDKAFPVCKIHDVPIFEYRGMHLDVCRHFFTINEVKQYIDYLTFYKYNTFHWHLTEDQGWRIEIKAYPRLQEIAAYRNETLMGHYNDNPHKYDGKRYGGYYTQEELKDVVAYAKSRGVTIIPEIEMPGHAQAAIAAYPELSCLDSTVEVATKWGVFENVYCPKEETFEFLQNVLDEVIDIFPSEYIHIGGDECPKTQWKSSEFCQNLMVEEGLKDENELQSYFISRMADYLHSKGRKIIGWDEILEGGLAEGATVMSWRGEKGGIEAAKAGHQVIMTPGSHCYFDHYQSNHPNEPLAIGGFTSVEDVYNYEPIPEELDEAERKFVLGAQGNVWTEYIPDFQQIEYMALARMMALSEVLSNDQSSRDYKLFFSRFSRHIDMWKSKQVNIADHRLDIELKAKVIPEDGVYINLNSIAPIIDGADSSIKIEFPSGKTEELKLPESGNLSYKIQESGAYTFTRLNKKSIGRSVSIHFEKHKATDASIVLKNQASEYYPGSGPTALINGINGSSEKYGGSEWLGFSSVDFEAEILMPELRQIDSISLRFFKGEGQWIYLPQSVELVCKNQSEETIIKSQDIEGESTLVEVIIPVNNNCQAINILAKNHGIIEAGKQGAGHGAWLFVDEIRVH